MATDEAPGLHTGPVAGPLTHVTPLPNSVGTRSQGVPSRRQEGGHGLTVCERILLGSLCASWLRAEERECDDGAVSRSIRCAANAAAGPGLVPVERLVGVKS